LEDPNQNLSKGVSSELEINHHQITFQVL